MKGFERWKRKAAFLLSVLLVINTVPRQTMEALASPQAGMAETISAVTVSKGDMMPQAPQTVSGSDTVSPGDGTGQTYAITVSGGNGGTVIVTDEDEGTDNDGADIPEGASRKVVAQPDSNYEITEVSAKRDSQPWTPAGAGAEWWKNTAYLQNDIFTFPIDVIDADYYFEVVFAQKQMGHRIQVVIQGEGTVTLQDGTELQDGSAFVETGKDITLLMKPDTGYQISSLTLDTQTVTPGECQLNAEGYYEYTISGVTADKELAVVFDEIPVETKTISAAGIKLTDDTGAVLQPEADNTLLAKKVIVSAESGEYIRLASQGLYESSVELTESCVLQEVYLRTEVPAAFDTERKIQIMLPITIIIDGKNPEILLTDAQRTIYVPEAAANVNISGKISDENPERVVWSDKALTQDEILKESTNVTKDFSELDGSFTIEQLAFDAGKKEMVYYVYGVDKAGNCSTASEVTVKRDSTAPVLTEVEIVPDIQEYDFGNFHNSAVTLRITAHDADMDASAKTPASGIKSVKVYAGDNSALYYEGTVQTAVAEAEEAVIEVTIPLGEEEGFASLKELKMTGMDSVGNESTVYTLTSTGVHPSEIKSDFLMLENTAPTASMTPDADYIQQSGTGVLYWFREIRDVEYNVSDETDSGKPGSGLAERKVFLNDNEIAGYAKDYTDGLTDYASVSQNDAVTLEKGELSAMTPGENTLKVWLKDLAGNESESSSTLCLDTQNPQITGFSITKLSPSGEEITGNFPFGVFANCTVKITVTARDDVDENQIPVPSSGLKSITLYLDGEAYKTVSAENGQAEFEIPADEILESEEKVYLDSIITASATDNVGNQSQECDMTTGNSNLLGSRLMIETKRPVVQAEISGEGYVDKNGNVYHNSDVEFQVTATDAESGLRSVKIDINGTLLVDERIQNMDSAVLQKDYTVSTRDASATEEGLYILTVTAVDNAGNEAMAYRQVYKDETSPEILQFEMEAAGTVDGDGTSLSYEERDYGFYFQEDTKVTIRATDGTRDGDAGVKEIRYYIVDVNGQKSETTTLFVNEEEAVVFVIPAELKGQIYACAYDWLGNSTEKYVTPDGIIIETPQQHEKEEHIFFQKADAPATDNNGRELYTDNVTVDVAIADTFSGIRKVEWNVEVPYDGAANQSGLLEISNDGTFAEGSSTDGWTIAEIEKNLVTRLQKSIVVSGNSNDIRVHVKMTDRAGNTSEKELTFSIDRTNPVIEITFDNMTPDGEYQEMFNADRTATITVTERNFSGQDFTVNITNTDGVIPGISEWSTAVNAEDPDRTTSTATVTFSQDGDYTMEVSGHDRAGRQADAVRAADFTIDKTRPVITVTYDNQNAQNGNYFAAQRTATIRVEEHNFTGGRVTVNGTATDNGSGIAFPATGSFSDNGDVHTANIVCGTDGLYRFDVECVDRAGNEAEVYIGEEYYVDMTAPEIEIQGVEDMSANNGDVIPRIVLTDTNYDTNGVSIELTGANRGAVSPEGTYTSQGNGQVFTFDNFPKEKSYDDIYTLNATLTDMAGNEKTESIQFSVNRFGSVYVFDDSLKEIAGTYIQEEIDVKLTEVNVDSLEHDKIKVVLDVNGTPRDLTEGTDYTVEESGGNGSWHQYAYTLHKSLFSGDGRYIVTLYSEDAAGNINENIAASKKAEISFGVDKTAPVVIPIDIESDTQYPVDVKTATIAVNDNLVLEDVEVFVGTDKCEYETDGENYVFQVPSATAKQDVTVRAVDAAGNRTNYVISGVLVTTNAFIRWYNNKPLFAGTLVGAAVIAGGGIGLAFALRSGRLKVKRKK